MPSTTYYRNCACANEMRARARGDEFDARRDDERRANARAMRSRFRCFFFGVSFDARANGAKGTTLGARARARAPSSGLRGEEKRNGME